MDLVRIAEFIAKNPFGLLIFLMVVVWYAAVLIQKKDEYMETHIKEDLQKAERREKWLQRNAEENTKHIINIENDVRDIWQVVRERRDSLEFEDQASSDSSNSDFNMHHSRRKLPTKTKGRE